MMWIGFRGLVVDCIIGVRDHERAVPQPLCVDLELRYHAAVAPTDDDPAPDVDYARIAEQVAEQLRTGRFGLLESAVAAIGTRLARSYPAIAEVRVELRKPRALDAADHSFARYEWKR